MEAIATRLKAIANWVEAIAIRVEAIAIRLEAIAIRFLSPTLSLSLEAHLHKAGRRR